MSDQKLTVVLLSVAVAVGAAAVALAASGYAISGTIGFEIVKLLVQFLLVGVLGVVISLLVQNYHRHRDRELTVNELRKSVLASLIRAYSDTKRARRVIMAHRLGNRKLSYEVYDEQMKSIIETQLALEILNHQIQTLRAYFGEQSPRIVRNVESMEKFLGDIIDEYKDSLHGTQSYPEYLPLEDLPKLSSGMGKRNETNHFGARFVEPYREAVATIRQQILQSTSRQDGAITPAASES